MKYKANTPSLRNHLFYFIFNNDNLILWVLQVVEICGWTTSLLCNKLVMEDKNKERRVINIKNLRGSVV